MLVNASHLWLLGYWLLLGLLIPSNQWDCFEVIVCSMGINHIPDYIKVPFEIGSENE